MFIAPRAKQIPQGEAPLEVPGSMPAVAPADKDKPPLSQRDEALREEGAAYSYRDWASI